GTWQGDRWQNVTFASTPEAQGWYSGTFEDFRGNRGVLHLEWSRLQRRYNGRWRVGKDQSGPITLRSQDGMLRGAVSFDAESTVDIATPRLRDFSWRQGDTINRPASRSTISDRRRYQVLVPKAGILSKISEGLKVSESVQKGQVLATMVDEPALASLESQKKVIQREIKDAKSLVAAKIGELDVAERSFQAAKVRVAGYRDAKDMIDDAAITGVKSASAGIGQAKRKVVQLEQALSLVEEELAVSQKMSEKGMISATELASQRAKVSTAKFNIVEGQAAVEAAELATVAKEAERQVKLKNADSQIQDAIADQNAAEAEIARASTGLVEARALLAAAEQKLEVIVQQLTEVEQLELISPVDGVITYLDVEAVGQRIDGGVKLLTIDIVGPEAPPSSRESKPEQDFGGIKQIRQLK
ncbi:MAG: TolC family protein, partial [Planctomycetota bacterium]